MGLKITPLTAAIGAEVEGVSVAEPLQGEEREAINDALLRHQVLFFRNQKVTPEQQRAFARSFGELHVHPIYPNLGPGELEQIMLLDNDGDHPPDNARWHTDVTFIETPPMGTILAAKAIPALGGDTLFASGSAAFEALSPALQRFLAGLRAEHNFLKSFAQPRYHYKGGGDKKALWEVAVRTNPPVVHPLVRTHPESHRKALFLSQAHLARIVDLQPAESDALLAFLFAHATKPEFTVRWKWQPDDLAFWDNRVTQHYGVADYLPHRRIMHRATILGDKPF
jgi:taurine dioxygenase